MRKRLIALIMAACLAMAPVICFAEDETDYSYLEDMSIKEIRALNEAIESLLAGEEVTEDIDTVDLEEMTVKELKGLKSAIGELLGEDASDDEANEEKPELKAAEKEALLCLQIVKDALKNPESLQVHNIWYCCYPFITEEKQLESVGDEDCVIIDLSAQNSMGGLTRDYYFFTTGIEDKFYRFSDVKDKDLENDVPLWVAECVVYLVNIDNEGYPLDTDRIFDSLE